MFGRLLLIPLTIMSDLIDLVTSFALCLTAVVLLAAAIVGGLYSSRYLREEKGKSNEKT